MPIIGPVCCCCYSVVKDRQPPSGAAADCREELPNLLELITRVKLFFYLPLRLSGHLTTKSSNPSRSPRSLQARALKTAANYLNLVPLSIRKTGKGKKVLWELCWGDYVGLTSFTLGRGQWFPRFSQ